MENFNLVFGRPATPRDRDNFVLSFYTLSGEGLFRASFEDASGRDPLATALLARDDAKKLCSHNVICYQYPPMLADLIIEVPIGSFYLVTPGRMVWIKLEHNPLFKMGRWAQVQSRRPLGIDSTLVDIGVRISDHPESFLEPT